MLKIPNFNWTIQTTSNKPFFLINWLQASDSIVAYNWWFLLGAIPPIENIYTIFMVGYCYKVRRICTYGFIPINQFLIYFSETGTTWIPHRNLLIFWKNSYLRKFFLIWGDFWDTSYTFNFVLIRLNHCQLF